MAVPVLVVIKQVDWKNARAQRAEPAMVARAAAPVQHQCPHHFGAVVN
jgi:hypothetical protein